MESCCMPEDVIRDILLRLPVKSLMRCRCVCKSWGALISSSYFITQHLHIQSTSNNDNRLLVFNHRDDTHLLVFDDETLDAVVVTVDIPTPFVDEEVVVLEHEFVGACNGILCILCDFFVAEGRGIQMIELLNPATKEVKVLPVPCIPLPFISWTQFGFGFDAKTSDYKVVRIVKSVPPAVEVYSPAVEVYSLITNCWKEIDFPVSFSHINMASSGTHTYLDGIYYWWASTEYNGVLLTFDMADEEFQMMTLPNGINYYPELMGLSVLKGSIALIVNHRGDACDIWLTDKDVKNSSWVHHLTMVMERPLYGTQRPGFRVNDEILFVSGSRLTSYDLKSLVVRDRHIDYWLPHLYGDCVRLVAYKESLVSLKDWK